MPLMSNRRQEGGYAKLANRESFFGFKEFIKKGAALNELRRHLS